jgi:hypothetical protein
MIGTHIISFLVPLSSNRIAVIRCFGLGDHVTICRAIDVLDRSSFSGLESLLTVEFDEGSKLTRIAQGALFQCSALTSICIRAGVECIPADRF